MPGLNPDTPTVPQMGCQPPNTREAPRIQHKEAKQHLALVVETASGEVIEAEIADLSFKGVGVWLPDSREHLPRLQLGAQLRLVFFIEDLPQPLVMRATVCSGLELRGFQRYGFEFEEPRELAASLSSRLLSLLNRRRDDRVQPLEELVVALETSEGIELTARLKDISTSGIGVTIESDADIAVAVGEGIEVSLRLPDQPTRLKLLARVRHRDTEGKAVRYGLEFDQSSEDFGRQRAAIADFVVRNLADREDQQEAPFDEGSK